MKHALTMLCLIALTFECAAADNDVAGYGAARWGMTPDQVLAAEKRAKRLEPPKQYKSWQSKVEIPAIEIGHNDWHVDYLFDNAADKLAQINLSPVDKSPSLARVQFPEVEKLLTEKYGPPTFHNRTTDTWKLKANEVEVHLMDLPGMVTLLTITYRPIDSVKNGTDNL